MNRLILPIFFALLAVAIPTLGIAQTLPVLPPIQLAIPTLSDLMNITITTATRRPEGVGDVPARVQVVTAAQIQARGYRSLSDVLKDLADFKVDFAGDQDYPTELAVQGTRGAGRVVVMLDGIRVMSPTGEPLPILANYPVHNARQVEILFGPSSALYGADAFSAVINIISKDADESAGLSVSSSAGQFGLTNQTATYARRLGAASLLVSGQFLYDQQPDLTRFYPADFGGLTSQHSGTFNTIFGPMTPSRPVSAAYDIPLSAHSVHATLRTGGLQLSFFTNRSRVSTAPAYTPDNAVYNPDAFNRNTLYVGAGAYARTFGRVTSTSTLTTSRHELDPQSGYWNVFSNMEKSYKYAYGSSTRLEEQLSWKPVAGATLIAGGTFERFFSIPQGADLNTPIFSHDVSGTILGTDIVDDLVKLRYANTGAYAQLQYALSSTVVVTLGARGDYNTRFGPTFNPRAGVVAHLTPDTTFKLLYGTAFLAPTPYQENSHYGSFYSTDGGATFASDYWHLPNPDLKPQRKKTLEANVVQRFGSAISVSASAFVAHLTDLIQGADPDQSYAGTYHGWPVAYIDFSVNEGGGKIFGGTIGLEFLKSFGTDRSIAGRVALSVADGKVWIKGPSDRLPLGGMSPIQVRIGADTDWNHWTIAPRLAIVGTQRLLAITDDGQRHTLPGYATVDLTIRRRHLLGRLGAFLTIENALDARYRNINTRAYTNPEELIGAPQNPRRLTVGLDLRLR